MPPTLPTASERASQLWLPIDVQNHLTSASKFFADEETLIMFRALHKGLAVLSMQANITGAERLSSVSPYHVNPYKRTIWLPIDGGAGLTHAFSAPVYRLVGIKKSPVVLDTEGNTVDDWLTIEDDYTWDADTSTITFSADLVGGTITDTANGGGLVRCTATAHGLATGARVKVSGLTDVADGVVDITVIDANTFDIDGSTFATADDTGTYSHTTQVITGYNQKAVLDEDDNPRYTYDPVYANVQITGKAGFALVDDEGNPITEQVITSYTQGAALTEDDLDDPIIADEDVYRIPEDTYYVVEAIQENPYMWNVTAASIGFTKSLRPLGFTPEHIPYVLQCLENALQKGFSSSPFRWALNALAGNPFAYGAGRIVAYELTGDTHYAVIEDYDDEEVWYCEVPQACNLKVGILKAVGTEVAQFEPLLLDDPAVVGFEDQNQDTEWGTPVAVHQLSNEEIGVGQARFGQSIVWNEDISHARDLLRLDIARSQPAVQTWNEVEDLDTGVDLVWGDSAVLWNDEELSNFAAGRPILIRNLHQGWGQVFSIRRSEKGRLYLDGYLPDIEEGQVLFAQALVKDAESARRSEIVVWAPALRASIKPLLWLIDRVVPASISVNLILLQQAWDRLYCPWEEQTGAWHTATPGQHWETAQGIYWNFNELSWAAE